MTLARPNLSTLAVCLGLSTSALVGCGGGSTGSSSGASTGASGGESSGSTGTTGSTSTGGSAARPPNGRTAHELDMLRPAGTEAPLAGVARDPLDSEAFARGALAYAGTEVPGMTLLWGQVYRILDSHGRRTVDISNAMATVIREKFVADATGNVTAHLAPGNVPTIRGADGRTYAPFAHLYEHSMSQIPNPPVAFDQYEGQVGVILGQLRVTCRQGQPVLDDPTYAWLCEMSAAGHSDAYTHWVIGPAFGPQWEAWRTANAQKLDRYESWTHMHRFEPRRATRPDDLHPVRAGD